MIVSQLNKKAVQREKHREMIFKNGQRNNILLGFPSSLTPCGKELLGRVPVVSKSRELLQIGRDVAVTDISGGKLLVGMYPLRFPK